MKISLVVATYNWPGALELTLMSAARQTRLPDEIVIADDGSGPDTREVVARLAAESRTPMHHVWQEDEGWRLARIRNLATAKATGDVVVFVDGDMVLHPRFVADHERAAKPGVYMQGTRALLGSHATRRMLRDKSLDVNMFSRDLRRRRNALHAPLLGRPFGWPRKTVAAAKGCNMAMWRSDLARVNGFNEEMKGWGREDNEIVSRLISAGVKRRYMRFQALAFHLHHELASRMDIERNTEVLMRTVRDGLVRCDSGLDQHYG